MKSLTQELQQAARVATETAEILETLAAKIRQDLIVEDEMTSEMEQHLRQWRSKIEAAANKMRRLAKRLDHDAVP